jgi:hypothetical protein
VHPFIKASQHTQMSQNLDRLFCSYHQIQPHDKSLIHSMLPPQKQKQAAKGKEPLTISHRPWDVQVMQNLYLFLHWDNSLSAPKSPKQASATNPSPMGFLPAHTSTPNTGHQQVRCLLTFSTSCLGCGGSMHVRSLSNKSMIAEVPICFIIRSTKSRFFFKKSTI